MGLGCTIGFDENDDLVIDDAMRLILTELLRAESPLP